MGMGIIELYRHVLHVAEQIQTHVMQRTRGNDAHDPAVNVGSGNAAHVDAAHLYQLTDESA